MIATKEINQSQLLPILSTVPTKQRAIVAIAGAPGSGKTTLVDWLVNEASKLPQFNAQALHMDGFHIDNNLLARMDLLPRKGSPQTFDVMGLENTLQRIQSVPADDVFVPVFDRDLEIARAGASLISKDTNLLFVEGNYILCSAQPWDRLHQFFDLRILIKVPKVILEERLQQRWKYYGLEGDSINLKIYQNDLPNGDFVMEHSHAVDYHLIQTQE